MRVLAIMLLTAGAVTLARGGEAFWLCVPLALLAAASCSRPRAALAAGAVVVLAAAIPALSARKPLSSPALAAAVPLASIYVLLRLRARLEHERDAMRTGALTDALTGTANRRLLEAQAEHEIARYGRSRRGFAILLLDLDGFKPINDRFGHAAGDEVLQDVATSIRRAIRDQDTVARIGGDEFCVLAPETDVAGADRLATRVNVAVARVTAGIDALAASHGLAVFPRDGRELGALLRHADAQLLAAKRQVHRGRGYRRAA